MQNDLPRLPNPDDDDLERDVARAREQFSDSLNRATDHGEEVVKETLSKAKPVLIVAGAITAVAIAGVLVARLMRPKPLRIPVPQFVAPPASPSPAAAIVRSLLVSVASYAGRQLTERFLRDTRDTMPRLGTGRI